MMSDTKVDWRTLKPGRELDRVIAERLGWDNFFLGSDDVLYADTPEIRADPRGWQESVKPWSTNEKDTLSLPLPDDFHRWVLSRDDNEYEAAIETWDSVADYGHERHLVVVETVTSTYGYADAMCRAWLEMGDRS